MTVTGGCQRNKRRRHPPPPPQVWDMTTPALDPVTRAPVVPASAAAPGAGEPAVALHGFIASFAPDADDDTPEAPTKAVHNSSPRPTALHWHAGGAALVVADSLGCLRSGRLSGLLRAGGEPVRALGAPVPWPLICRVRAGGGRARAAPTSLLSPPSLNVGLRGRLPRRPQGPRRRRRLCAWRPRPPRQGGRAPRRRGLRGRRGRRVVGR